MEKKLLIFLAIILGLFIYCRIINYLQMRALIQEYEEFQEYMEEQQNQPAKYGT